MRFPGRFLELTAVAWLMLAGVLAPGHAEPATADEAAWIILKETGTAEQLRRFIAAAPEGPQRREAEKRLAILDPAYAAGQAATGTPAAGTAGPGQEKTDQEKTAGGVQPAQDLPPAQDARSGDFEAPQFNPNLPQKVVLYEEDLANPNGMQFAGSAGWRIEPEPAAAGRKSGVAIRADIDIPERQMSVRLVMRRNDDKTLKASHTVEVVFSLQPGFVHGGIGNIPGLMVKQGETTRGVALNGVVVKVQPGFFLVGLSANDAEMKRNVQFLKERQWFDIPVVYADGKRALIAIDKGKSGARVFDEAFAAWEQEDRARAAGGPKSGPPRQ
jgi:hypothetical protein